MIKLITDVFTEPDGITWCPTRIAIGIANLIYHGMTVVGLAMGQLHIDLPSLAAYVTNMVQLIGFGTAAVGAKSVLKADAKTTQGVSE
jgi:hypothetical protein